MLKFKDTVRQAGGYFHIVMFIVIVTVFYTSKYFLIPNKF